MIYGITGITGTLGKEVSKKLLAQGHKIIGISRDEQKQAAHEKHENLTLRLCDIRDKERVAHLFEGVDSIFHFAAMKCIDQCEENVDESVKTNILGTENVYFAQRTNNIPKLTFVSTDKAVFPITVYGAHKFSAESIVMKNPNNVVCRYGNVLASRGSVVKTFVDSILLNGSVNITHKAMTRFFWTIDEASSFVIDASDKRGLHIPEMKGCYIVDVAKCIGKILNKEVEINYTGLRCKEKIHEDLDGFMNSRSVTHFKDYELFSILKPIVEDLL